MKVATVATVPVPTRRLRRLLDRKMIPSVRLESKVAKLVAGTAVVFTVAEVAVLMLAIRKHRRTTRLLLP